MEYTDDLERIARVDPAAHEEAQPAGEGRRDPHRGRHRCRLRCPHAVPASTTSSGAAARSTRTTRSPSLKRKKDGTWRLKLRQLGRPDPQGRACPLRVRRRRRRCARAAAALGHPRDQGLRRVPDQRASSCKTTNPKIVAQHQAKVYGKAAVGAPPMSVPHLDTRVVDGETALLFGPYAGFTPKFLKSSTWFDLPFSIRFHNLVPMLAGGAEELRPRQVPRRSEVIASRAKKLKALREFMPTAKDRRLGAHHGRPARAGHEERP